MLPARLKAGRHVLFGLHSPGLNFRSASGYSLPNDADAKSTSQTRITPVSDRGDSDRWRHACLRDPLRPCGTSGSPYAAHGQWGTEQLKASRCSLRG